VAAAEVILIKIQRKLKCLAVALDEGKGASLALKTS
jgi:hypothetical protein